MIEAVSLKSAYRWLSCLHIYLFMSTSFMYYLCIKTVWSMPGVHLNFIFILNLILNTMQQHVVTLPVHDTCLEGYQREFFLYLCLFFRPCLNNCSSAGRILNRFSSDSATVDNSLPFIANILLANTAALFGVLLVLAYNQPLLLIIFIPLAILYVAIQASC